MSKKHMLMAMMAGAASGLTSARYFALSLPTKQSGPGSLSRLSVNEIAVYSAGKSRLNAVGVTQYLTATAAPNATWNPSDNDAGYGSVAVLNNKTWSGHNVGVFPNNYMTYYFDAGLPVDIPAYARIAMADASNDSKSWGGVDLYASVDGNAWTLISTVTGFSACAFDYNQIFSMTAGSGSLYGTAANASADGTDGTSF